MRSYSAEEVIVNPLFYDALSGPFTLEYDHHRKQHTLGRLAISTFINGERIFNYDLLTEDYVVKRYSPSWAQHVDATVVGEPTGKFFRLRVIDLKPVGYANTVIDDEFGVRVFGVHDTPVQENGPYGLETNEWVVDTRYDLVGPKANPSAIQELIANKTKELFEKLHRDQ